MKVEINGSETSSVGKSLCFNTVIDKDILTMSCHICHIRFLKECGRNIVLKQNQGAIP